MKEAPPDWTPFQKDLLQVIERALAERAVREAAVQAKDRDFLRSLGIQP